MRPTLLAAICVLCFPNLCFAETGSSMRIAETGGYLLGNAHRCGIPSERVGRAAKVIRRVMVAASEGPSEEAAAKSRFAEMFLASAFPDEDGDGLIPPCRVVIGQFERLEAHHQQAGMN
jgi:hypothetical protein